MGRIAGVWSKCRLVGVGAIAITCLGACAVQPPGPVQQVPEVVGVDRSLAESASNASKALAELAAVNASMHPSARRPVAPQGGGLTLPITLHWDGPVESVLSSIAQKIGWRLRIDGKQPYTPLLVSISADSLSAFDVLEDIGSILGDNAIVRLNGSTQTIILNYVGGR